MKVKTKQISKEQLLSSTAWISPFSVCTKEIQLAFSTFFFHLRFKYFLAKNFLKTSPLCILVQKATAVFDVVLLPHPSDKLTGHYFRWLVFQLCIFLSCFFYVSVFCVVFPWPNYHLHSCYFLILELFTDSQVFNGIAYANKQPS